MWNTASFGPFTLTLSRLKYQPERLLTLNFSFDVPFSISNVHFTSSLVNGLPSCHFTPSRSLKVRVL